jgi:hypothetical protein
MRYPAVLGDFAVLLAIGSNAGLVEEVPAAFIWPTSVVNWCSPD